MYIKEVSYTFNISIISIYFSHKVEEITKTEAQEIEYMSTKEQNRIFPTNNLLTTQHTWPL